MDNLLKINNLSVSFNIENKISSAVKNISLDVAKGEALGIVGESGSGKSVTALSVLKLLPYPKAFHPSGEIFYKNKNILILTGFVNSSNCFDSSFFVTSSFHFL